MYYFIVSCLVPSGFGFGASLLAHSQNSDEFDFAAALRDFCDDNKKPPIIVNYWRVSKQIYDNFEVYCAERNKQNAQPTEDVGSPNKTN